MKIKKINICYKKCGPRPGASAKIPPLRDWKEVFLFSISLMQARDAN
jgi:hypothetical protein